jgi:hypothetical protein
MLQKPQMLRLKKTKSRPKEVRRMHFNTSKRTKFALIGLTFVFSIGCSLFSGISQDIEQGIGTAQAVITQAQGLATEVGPYLQTAQAYATQNPGLLETVQALATQNAPMLSTLQAVATEKPGLVQTVQAAITANLPSGEVPADIPVVDQPENLYASEHLVTYSTTRTFQEVLTFYQIEMSAFGWEADPSASHTLPVAAMLVYKQVNRTATINVTVNPTNQTTFVVISIENNGN